MLPQRSRPGAIIGRSSWGAPTSPTRDTSWSGRTRAASPRSRGLTTRLVSGTQRSAFSPAADEPRADDDQTRKVFMKSQHSERTRMWRLRLIQALSVVGLLWAMGETQTNEPNTPAVACASLNSFTLPHVQIISATHNAAAGGLPAYCNVVGVINKRVSAQDPAHFVYGIGFEVNLADAWSGNFELVGGGGVDGSLANPVGFFGSELAQGWAVASDDGGFVFLLGGFLFFLLLFVVVWCV